MPLLPTTRLARWGSGVTLAGVILQALMLVVTTSGITAFMIVFAGGVLSLIAIVGPSRERSAAAFVGVLLGVAVVVTIAFVAISEST